MNTKHRNIRFTFEIEDQNSFSFLDMKIITSTEKKTFETSIYRKSTISDAFTNFKSFILMPYKSGFRPVEMKKILGGLGVHQENVGQLV